jgi:O-succinylbenzoic acid--CoA ligase
MDKTAQRELIRVGNEWSVSQISKALISVLTARGPALEFGEFNTQAWSAIQKPASQKVPTDCAVVISTSGSTGNAKQVCLSAGALVASAYSAHSYLGAHRGERWSLVLPLTHIAGVNVLVRAIELGLEAVDNRNVDQYSQAEYVSVVPTQLHRALYNESDKKLLAHLQGAVAVLVGGGPTNEFLIAQAKEHGVNVITTYGMTEMCGGCIFDGNPLSKVEMKITEVGRIKLKGPMRANGYLNDEHSWASVIDGAWFTTSDLGRIEAGRLQILGRIDDQIISGGKKISLNEIELSLHSLFPAQQFIAFAIPDPEWGQALALASSSKIAEASIKDHLRKTFGGYGVPKFFLQLEEFPTKGIEKPDRNRLREILSSQLANSSQLVENDTGEMA